MKNIKKIIAAAIAVMICLSAGGCSSSEDTAGSADITEYLAEDLSVSSDGDASAAEENDYGFDREMTMAPEETGGVLSPADSISGKTIEGGTVDAADPAETASADPDSAADKAVRPNYTVEEISGYFDQAMLKEIYSREENTVASPLSVKLALNMAAIGAEEATEKELLTLFGYESSEEMRENSKALVSELDRADGSITVNNSVWIDSDFHDISESYTGGLGEVFNAAAFREKLSDNKIAERLNGWIDEKTNGLIPNMVTEPFREDTAMLLVNALYFKNEWVREFDAFHEGISLIFHGTKGDCSTAGMYLKYDGIRYAENEFFRSVSLDYKDGSYMNIYIPETAEEGVLDIVEKLSPKELAAAMDMSYSEKKVNIEMPRFECEYRNSLKEILQKLGVYYTFDMDLADFDGMLVPDSEERLYISDVIHAAKLECNEKGTEAAAATIAAAATAAAEIEEPPIYFTVDRPFIYELKAPSGETLFMGTICGF